MEINYTELGKENIDLISIYQNRVGLNLDELYETKDWFLERNDFNNIGADEFKYANQIMQLIYGAIEAKAYRSLKNYYQQTIQDTNNTYNRDYFTTMQQIGE